MKYLTAENLAIITAVLLAVSEGLASIPAVKSNSIFQLIYNTLKKIGGKREISVADNTPS